jgi:peptidoglycan/xylan/chitin deacetylase (PgdA/CDA1 family)
MADAEAAAHGRRRAGALAMVAGVALVVGIAVGVATPGPSRHGPQSAITARDLRRLARRAARGEVPTSLSAQENAAIDRTLARTPYVRIAGTQHRELALTFDDGPGPYTPQILAVLSRTHTPATFFEVGEEDRYFGVSTTRIVAMGDPIGDHTETHAAISELSYRRQERQLLLQAAATGADGAAFPRMFRPPYGLWDATTLRLLGHLHMLMVLWSVDTEDWRRPGTPAIVKAAVDGAKPGAIILIHDAGGDRSQTVTALPTIIRVLRRTRLPTGHGASAAA